MKRGDYKTSKVADLHGVLLSIEGKGVLIVGEARVGKSECALELISRGHKLIADDVVILDVENGVLCGSAPEMFRGLLEIRDLGILDVREIFGSRSFAERACIDLVIELVKDQNLSNDGSIRIGDDSMSVGGLSLRKVRLRISRGRNLSVLIETAVKLLSTKEHKAVNEMLKVHKLKLASVPHNSET